MAEISVTLKGGPSYDAPWIVVRGESIEEIDRTLGQLSEAGAFVAVQTLSSEFRNAPIVTSDDALRVVQDKLGATEVPTPGPAASSPTPATSQPAQPATPSSTSVQQTTPPCETCGQPTDYRSGNHPTSGAWEAYFCSSGDRAHTKFLGR